MAQHDLVIETLAGIGEVDEPSGTITVVFDEASTHMDLEVVDATGTRVTVHIGYHMATALMVELGRVCSHL